MMLANGMREPELVKMDVSGVLILFVITGTILIEYAFLRYYLKNHIKKHGFLAGILIANVLTGLFGVAVYKLIKLPVVVETSETSVTLLIAIILVVLAANIALIVSCRYEGIRADGI